MVWLKALHIAALVIWCGGLFYLPAVFAEIARAPDRSALHRSHVMARVVYVVLISPAAIIAIVSGTFLAVVAGAGGLWFVAKLTIVALMVFYHLQCGRMVTAIDVRPHSFKPARSVAMMLAPTVLVPLTLWLVMAKPF